MPSVVVWANCQGGALTKMLRVMHPNEFEVHWFKNYEYIQQGLELPSFMKEADIFIYQNYRPKKYSVYDLDYISDNILKADCLKVSFPTLHSIALQFCHDYYEPNNQRTVGAGFPHGHFKFGIKPISDLFQKIVDNSNDLEYRKKVMEQVIGESMTETFISDDDIVEHANRSFTFLSDKALSSDIPGIHEYVLDNYKRIRLWHNPYHPNGVLLNELCRQVFAVLGIPYRPSKASVELLDQQLRDWVMPILPSVQKKLGLQIGDACLSKYHPQIKCTETYIRAYLTSLYLEPLAIN